MKKGLPVLLLFVFISFRSLAAEDIVSYRPFARLHVYQPAAQPVSNVVVLLSGDGGWVTTVVELARVLSDENNALVVGIEIRSYLHAIKKNNDQCSYPAGDLEKLSMWIQRKYGIKDYKRPLLIGYSSGATLAYATLVQAPPDTFLGAMSFGFCSDFKFSKPLCSGNGLESRPLENGNGFDFLPAKSLQNPWVAFQGEIDQVCHEPSTENFVKEVPQAEFVSLPKVGHGFKFLKSWLPKFDEKLEQLNRSVFPPMRSNQQTSSVSDLPLIELPASGKGDWFAVIVSGDGGWASLDRQIGTYLSTRGIPVVGLDSLRYFWKEHPPAEVSHDLNRILLHYEEIWNKPNAVLIGYSFGADVLPFMVGGLPQTTLSKIRDVVMMGPSQKAVFEFHLTDWIGVGKGNGTPVLPELEKIKGPKILLLCGAREPQSLCREFQAMNSQHSAIEWEFLAGGHHFAEPYQDVAQLILNHTHLKDD